MTKSSVTIYLDSDLRKALESRAKKELLSIEELIIDIIRRSTIKYKNTTSTKDNVDDKFLTLFSRKNTKKNN